MAIGVYFYFLLVGIFIAKDYYDLSLNKKLQIILYNVSIQNNECNISEANLETLPPSDMIWKMTTDRVIYNNGVIGKFVINNLVVDSEKIGGKFKIPFFLKSLLHNLMFRIISLYEFVRYFEVLCTEVSPQEDLETLCLHLLVNNKIKK